jgi:hypothetical protein
MFGSGNSETRIKMTKSGVSPRKVTAFVQGLKATRLKKEAVKRLRLKTRQINEAKSGSPIGVPNRDPISCITPQITHQIRVPNGGPISGYHNTPHINPQIGVQNWGPKSGSQIGVSNWGPKSGSQIRVTNRGHKSGYHNWFSYIAIHSEKFQFEKEEGKAIPLPASCDAGKNGH